MKRREPIVLVLLCSLLTLSGSGCCTIMSGSTQKIPISSTPSGARVTADNGTSITTPGSIVLERKIRHTLVAEYPGCKEQQQQLQPKLNNWVWANILIGGLIGLVIDIVSGSVNELQPKEVHFRFEETSGKTSTSSLILYRDILFETGNDYRLLRIYKSAA
jgi:hypothetical protein